MNRHHALVCLVGGMLVLASYSVFIPACLNLPDVTYDTLWTGIKGGPRNLYYISILTTTVFMLIFFLDWVKKSENDVRLIVYIVMFFIGASLWAPALYGSLKKATDATWTSLSLALTSLGAVGIWNLCNNSCKLTIQIATTLLLWQTVLLDFGIWNTRFIHTQ